MHCCNWAVLSSITCLTISPRQALRPCPKPISAKRPFARGVDPTSYRVMLQSRRMRCPKRKRRASVDGPLGAAVAADGAARFRRRSRALRPRAARTGNVAARAGEPRAAPRSSRGPCRQGLPSCCPSPYATVGHLVGAERRRLVDGDAAELEGLGRGESARDRAGEDARLEAVRGAVRAVERPGERVDRVDDADGAEDLVAD